MIIERREVSVSPKSVGEAIAAAVVNGLVLWVLNHDETWRPWTHGVVTDAWASVLPWLNVATVVQLAGNLLVAIFRAPLFGRVMEVVLTAAGVLGALALIDVYPFQFSRIAGPWLDLVVQLLLLLGVVGGSIGVLVAAVRVFTGGPRGRPRPRRTV